MAEFGEAQVAALAFMREIRNSASPATAEKIDEIFERARRDIDRKMVNDLFAMTCGQRAGGS